MSRAHRIARRRMQDAMLIDSFHLTPAQIGELTVRQIAELYFHPRDEKGGIEKPAPPASAAPLTEQQHLASWKALAKSLGIPRAKTEEKAREIREYYKKKKPPPPVTE